MRDSYPAGTRLAAGAAGALVPGFLHLWFSTCKVIVLNPDVEASIARTPIVAAILHKHLLFSAWRWRNRRYGVMISRSKDGEIVTRVCERMGTFVARGSSSRAGASGLLRLIEYGRTGHSISLIVDGPKGPAGVSKMGVVVAARETGVPILPTGIVAENPWELKNWDRTAIPKPFSRIAVKFGAPIPVPRDADDAACEKLRRRVDESFANLDVELRVFLAMSRKR